MDGTPEQIMNHIELQRDELGRNLSELESRVKRSTDWRAQFGRNPILMIGVAMGGGLLIGTVVGGRSSRTTSPRDFSSAHNSLDHVKAAVIGFAMAKLQEFVSESLASSNLHGETNESTY